MADLISFFEGSELLDYMVLRPLSHIRPYWELMSDGDGTFLEEEDSYAGLLNNLIFELATVSPPKAYHDNEDMLAEYVLAHLNWDLRKIGRRWKGAEYRSILEQGGFHDQDQANLVAALAGRLAAAINRGQRKFDDIEESHRYMIAVVMATILYHRSFA